MIARWTTAIALIVLLLTAAASRIGKDAERTTACPAAPDALRDDAADDAGNGQAALLSGGDRCLRILAPRSRQLVRVPAIAPQGGRPPVLRESRHDIDPTRSCGGIDSSLFSLHCRLTL
ncbi:MAG: hypothetical protein JXL80_03140 [Planctomycetes bacterium]|nr:hypothetical protein [Planctomycetota bacterium]